MATSKIQIERINMTLFATGFLALVAATGPSTAHAGQSQPTARFEKELVALAQYNRTAPGDSVGTLFIGSSSIRLWNVKADFSGYRPLNHGFGGATVLDVLANYDLLTANYAPQTIIVYVGENDIVQGRDANAVAADIIALLSRLRADFPKSRIVYLSMKSSPARWLKRDAFEQANFVLMAQSELLGGFDYVDATSSLMLPGDTPDLTCFSPDGIHLSALGYARWRKIVDGYLTTRTPGSASAAAPVSTQASAKGGDPKPVNPAARPSR